MQNIFLEYMENNEPFGLLPFAVPTGSGKTYSALHAIYDYSVKYFSEPETTKEKGPIVFITNQKKNLPETELRKIFKENQKEKLFDTLFLRLYSNSESVIRAIQKYDYQLISEIPSNIDHTKISEIINYLTQALDLAKLKTETEKQGIVDPIRNKYINQEEKNFREIIEPRLRKNITSIVRKNFKSESDFIQAITNDKDWKWIAKLYPTAYINQKKIIMMSVDKFINLNTNLIDTSFTLYTSDKLQNGTVIIDEFDAAYNVILNKIISDNLKNQIDVIKLFTKIYSKLKNHVFVNDLINKDYELNKDQIKEMLKRLTYDGEEIFKKFNMQFNLKSEFDINDNIEQSNEKNLLYQSLDYISVCRKDNIKLFIKPSPKDKLNKIIPVETKNLSSSYYKDYTLLENLLHELQRFLNFFRVITNYMAINYLNKRNNLIVTKETESFKPTLNLENALYTVLEEFDLDSNETSFLMNDVQIRSKLKKPVSNKSKNKEKAPKNYDFDQSFHIMGCKIVTLIDSINHDTKTKPYIYTIPYTPEIVLLAMTQSCKVIGISATATIPTVIDNFDLGYIKSKLKNNFRSLNEEQKEIQKHNFEESIKNYKNPDGTDRIKIHTKIIDHPQSYDSNIWKNLFNDIEDEAKRNSLAQILDNVLKESYSKNNISLDPKKQDYNNLRYYRIAYVFTQFIKNKDIRSLLSFLTTHPKTNSTAYINKNVLEAIFAAIIKLETKLGKLKLKDHPKFDLEKNLIYLTSENFEQSKKYFVEKLKKGEKVFLITAYQTIGAGQNCDYPIPEDLIDKMIHSNDFPKRKTKDFDSIYLEKPTNIIPNLTSYEENPEEAALRYLIITERLKENAEINHFFTKHHLKRALKYLQNPKRFSNKTDIEIPIKSLLKTQSAKFSATQILIQAIGRICRTNQKSENIYIFADNGISEVLEPSVLNENQYNPEFISLVQAFKNRLTNPNTGEDIEKFENETSDKSKKSNIEIKILLNNIFNKNHPTFIKEIYIKRWQKLRDFLLKYPTINENEIINITDNNIASSLYTKFAKPINAYSFSQTGDFEDTYVFLDKNQNDTTKLSAESSGLTKLMQIPGLKNHFINQGYATDFIPKNMIMTPPLFISIYKGALGEAAGKYILESLIVNQGKHLQLEEMPPEHYELFDFKVSEKQAYIDFKNWSNFTPKDRNEELEKIINKAKETNAKYVAIINIIKEKNLNIKEYDTIYSKEGIKIDLIMSLVEENQSGNLRYRNDVISKIKNNINSIP